MKKTFIIFIAILNLISFSPVSSAYAFVDPASLTLIFSAVFATAVTGAEAVKHSQDKSAQVQDKKKDEQKVQTQEKTDKVTEIGMNLVPSGS